MITVAEAMDFLEGSVVLTAGRDVRLAEGNGHFLARTVHALHDHPLFDMTAVDGYAFAFSPQITSWTVVAEIAAGEVFKGTLHLGECVRIFTGAMLPAGADTVVMQEFVKRTGDRITHTDDRLRYGGNVRLKGEQLKVGDLLLQAGSRLGPAEIGLLASAGVPEVCVHARPTVSVLRTGGEFAEGTFPAPGRIFSSNDALLIAALNAEGINLNGRSFTPNDIREELLRDLSIAMESSDLVISTGGVSVGDHDLVRSCLEELGAEVVFHGVEQKPGKPMLFARKGHTRIFALPGNPRAVLVGWHLYVRPFIKAMQGAQQPWMRNERLPLSHDVSWKGVRTDFRAGEVRNGEVQLLADEGSHMLAGMVNAEVLVELPLGSNALRKGEAVRVHYLPRP
ncbi:MAG: molybdopterin molybdotransferase MoeA [Flavobacteriales bacterium]|nr:molybdopterin molybdotransferase MoeA [Flavobacteriales bacterium]